MNILLGVTGSVAAIRTPLLYQAMTTCGWAVKVVATRAACYFFDPNSISPLPDGSRNRDEMILDEDEWPGANAGRRWQRDEPVLHIELRRWADVLVIAPLDANTLAKLANGLSDNCLTCVWRAWDLAKPVVLAPAMNTLMWEHPLTRRHFGELAHLFGISCPPDAETDGIIAELNRSGGWCHVVPPQAKRLACGDVGVGGMAEVEAIVESVLLMTPEPEA